MRKTEAEEQRFYKDGDLIKVEMVVHLTHEENEGSKQKYVPSIAECRYAVLPLNNKGKGYAIYDRLLCKIVNGVFYGEPPLDVAQYYNEGFGSSNMFPNGLALGLLYPEIRKDRNAPILIEE